MARDFIVVSLYISISGLTIAFNMDGWIDLYQKGWCFYENGRMKPVEPGKQGKKAKFEEKSGQDRKKQLDRYPGIMLSLKKRQGVGLSALYASGRRGLWKNGIRSSLAP
jgi:hypothetical protein